MKTNEIEPNEISSMLNVIPQRPDYDSWLRIASAVWSVLPYEIGLRLLHAWSPEEKDGEYARKYDARLKQIGIGTLVQIAKEHGFDLCADRAARKAQGRAMKSATYAKPQPFAVHGERVTFAKSANAYTNVDREIHAPEPEALPDVDESSTPHAGTQSERDFIEASRIAGELMRAHRAGLITGADDPDAAKIAGALSIFNGRILL